MAIIVETGTGSATAESYVSVAEARAYAGLYGYTLPVADADVEMLLRKAMRYIEPKSFQGYKISRSQALQWPRSGVVVDGYGLDPSVIPVLLKSAQIEAAVIAQTTPLLANNTSGVSIKRQKVDVIETEWMDGSLAAQPVLTTVDTLLEKLLVGGMGVGIRVGRA